MTLIFVLISVVLGIVAIACLLRFIFQAVAVNPSNTVVDSTRRLTDSFLSPLRKSLPRSRRYDLASFLVAWIAQAGRVATQVTQAPTQGNATDGLLDLVIVSLGFSLVRLIQYSIWIFIASIVVLVALSWFAPQSTSPYAQLARELPAFMLNPIRRFLPSLGILDLSPAILLLLLVTLNARIVPWLYGLVPFAN